MAALGVSMLDQQLQQQQQSGSDMTIVNRGDLDKCICTITQKIDELKSQIYESISAHHDKFTATFESQEEIQDRLAVLDDRIATLTSSVQSSQLKELVSDVREQRVLATQLKTTIRTINALKSLSQVDNQLNRFEEQMEQGHLYEAALLSQAMDKALSDENVADEQICNATIFRLLKSEGRNRRAHLASQLDDMWRRAIVFHQTDAGGLPASSIHLAKEVLSASSSVTVSLFEVLRAFDALEVLGSKLELLGSLFVRDVVAPLMRHPSATLSIKSQHQSLHLTWTARPSGAAAKGKRSAAGRAKIRVKDMTDGLGVLKQIFETFQQQIFASAGGDADEKATAQITAAFGLALYRAGAPCIVQDGIASLVPLADAETSAFEALKEEVDAMEASLQDTFGLQTEEVSQLRDYVRDHINLTANRQRMVCTSKHTGSCGLVCWSCEALHCFGSVRDVFDLFRAVVPAHSKAAMDSVPQPAVIFYNDCNYIAYHLTAMSHLYKQYLPTDTVQLATFVDLVPVFRLMGEQFLTRMLNAQHEQIMSSFDGLNGFSGLEEPRAYEKVDNAISQALHQLTVLSKIWKEHRQGLPARWVMNNGQGLMTAELYESTMGALEIIALRDISVEESELLHDLLRSPADAVCLLLEGAGQDLASAVTAWAKFTQLQEILNARLSEIAEKHQRHEWLFSGDELRSLVRALFSESEKRTALLQTIE
ncbi:uncharacterized protein MONBRDRAFT_31170 [Monosiga brevicollis MX1]|uniref:Uncharacterized protein n=1 Tax=Monosiga brevicollis TaxID=81824 RepID=A9US54_MONBE|nr:uncharacterized protein MONBRDRAFT_31170 [Monosiga brevicollis MX1]EDQ91720.1 predicted protein [Monosiga brevicollis MX1]|eukprot:XP_001743006.1 hypothetical protein [Monosiga brevicollis MX1]